MSESPDVRLRIPKRAPVPCNILSVNMKMYTIESGGFLSRRLKLTQIFRFCKKLARERIKLQKELERHIKHLEEMVGNQLRKLGLMLRRLQLLFQVELRVNIKREIKLSLPKLLLNMPMLLLLLILF